MEVPFIDLKAQYQTIRSEINEAVQSVLDSGQYVGGQSVRDFEDTFAALCGTRYCIGVGNGTDAIFVALKTLGVSTGDEIITPAFGWISSAETITLAGGKPVFVDILPDTFTINPELLEAKITPRTRGVILIHLYGQAAHVREIKKLCSRHGLFLIEDCAQAHLTMEFETHVGTIGDAGAFSFYPTKNLGAYGDAGCVITNQDDFQRKARLYANHGGLKQHLMEGINSRLDPLQAAILTVKSRYLEQWTNQRTANAHLYFDWLHGLEPVKLPHIRPRTCHTFHQFVIRAVRRNELKEFLSNAGIQTMIHYPLALPNLPAYHYLGHTRLEFPVSDQCQDEVLSLPIYPGLLPGQIEYVCVMIRDFYQKNKS
jgi:dTDP-4-amino-4,6-dideoxygalactose transaminase